MPTTPPKPSGNLTLSQIQQKFALDVSKQTGLDPRVILAQELAEAAYADNGTKGFNFLNLRDSTVASLGKPYEASSSGGFAKFHDLAQAEDATIAEFKSPAIRDFVYPNTTPRTQISGLASSPWDEGHYGNLVSDFVSLTGSQAALDQVPIRYNENTGAFSAANTEGVSSVGLFSVEGGLAVAGIALTGAPDAILAAGYEGAAAAARGAGAAAKGLRKLRPGATGGSGITAASLVKEALKVGAGVAALDLVATNWKRWLEVLGGGLLIIIGLTSLVKDLNNVYSAAEKNVKSVGVAKKNVGVVKKNLVRTTTVKKNG